MAAVKALAGGASGFVASRPCPALAETGHDVAATHAIPAATTVSFPQLAARDLGGREVALPAGLPGERNVVLIAFRRDQQQLVNSWVPWLEQRAAADPGLRFVELPALGLQWEPARQAIDGGMAAAIRDQAVRRRTLTVYTDLRRVTVPLGIDDRSTIWLCLVDRAGRVAWRGSGGLDPATAAALDTALATAPEPAAAAAQAAWPEAEQFEMAFDPGSGCRWLRSGSRRRQRTSLSPPTAWSPVSGRGSAARPRRTCKRCVSPALTAGIARSARGCHWPTTA